MANFEYLEEVGSQISEKANEAYEANLNLEVMKNRLRSIEDSISKMGDDQVMTEKFEKSREQAEQAVLEAQVKQEYIAVELIEMRKALEEIQTANESSAVAVQELAALGEDVGEANALISERRTKLRESYIKIQGLLGRLSNKI